jgi:hypothetical protein
MKKLMTLMLGMSLLFGAVGAVFAQGPQKGKQGGKKRSGKKKGQAPRKGGTSH